MITINDITLRNFMSTGNVTQSIKFTGKSLVLVLGENLDLGGNDSRNGVGKSTIVNALSYAFYGSALTNIRKDNLINKTNNKNMIVTVSFEKDGVEYTIERGRKPNKFSFMVGDELVNQDDSDEAQGDSRITQKEIERILGISHTMFKNIVALNTYSEPFLSMKAADQRDVIEQLLGITKLSEKAEILKERLRETKERVRDEEIRIQTVKGSNDRIQANIKSLEKKSLAWEENQKSVIDETREAITVLQGIDIDDEITKHKTRQTVLEELKRIKALNKERRNLAAAYRHTEELLSTEKEHLRHTEKRTCHVCGSQIDDESTQEKIKNEINERIRRHEDRLNENKLSLEKIETALGLLSAKDEDIPEVFYDDLEDAYNHRSSLDALRSTLQTEETRENHFIDQIENLKKTGIQEINYETMNDLTQLRDHQEFLLKLLTNKDSFIRRKIIDQNLSYLNARLEHYLDKIGLPHTVVFQSDLNVEIQEHGRDLDFDNLSRGEKTRLILSLSWAFRDVYESLNGPISLLFVDELIDSGLDTAGVESSIAVLKKMAREAGRNVFLISHRDELVGRVGSVLKVVKDGGFTTFEDDADV